MLSHQNLPRLSTDPVSRYAPSQRIEILHEIVESRIRRRVVTVHAALAPFYPDEVISFAHLLDIFRSVADFNRRVHFQICHPATFRCHLFVRFRDTQSTSTPQLPPLHPSPLGVPYGGLFFFFSGGGEIHYVQPPGHQVALESVGLLAVMVGASLPTKTPPRIHTQAPGTTCALLPGFGFCLRVVPQTPAHVLFPLSC
jgi:hypothetical protein